MQTGCSDNYTSDADLQMKQQAAGQSNICNVLDSFNSCRKASGQPQVQWSTRDTGSNAKEQIVNVGSLCVEKDDTAE